MGVNGGETAITDRMDWDRLLSEQIRQNGRFFFRLAHNVLRDAQLAEDVCQQVMLRAWEERSARQPLLPGSNRSRVMMSGFRSRARRIPSSAVDAHCVRMPAGSR